MQVGRIAAVAGASGYAGGELLRLLLGHPGLGVGPVAAGSAAGRPVTELHPQLPQLAGTTFAPTEPAVLAEADLVFLALPHGQSAALVAELPADLPVVDLGADFRLASAAAWSHLLRRHARRQLALRAARAARRPGRARRRHPGREPGLLRHRGRARPRAAAGGRPGRAGRRRGRRGLRHLGRRAVGQAALLGSEVMGALSSYKAGGVHQHTPEMEQSLSAAAGTDVTLSFTPVLAPMPRGILATCTARLAAGTDRGRSCGRRCTRPTTTSRSCTCCRRAPGRRPRRPSAATACTCRSPPTGTAAGPSWSPSLDNLVKGAAGQAVQNANLVLGLDETAGLPVNGVAP